MTRRMLITGAAGFIGRAAWDHFGRLGWQLFGLDDLSRPCSIAPALRSDDEFYQRNVCDIEYVELPNVDVVLHLAAQVSVTRSTSSPRRDFETNAMGTLHAALWARSHGVKCFIYASTNKVFGPLRGAVAPIEDDQPLAPTTPYGVSKACGGLYVRELLPDIGYDLRQSCIYGDTQYGTEDQGWVGYLARRIRDGEPLTCYGTGSQVRDLLHVADLVHLYRVIIDGAVVPGSYTVGGGAENAISFQEVVDMLGGKIAAFDDWRHDDQKYFVSANATVADPSTGWRPTILARTWLRERRQINAQAIQHAIVGDDAGMVL